MLTFYYGTMGSGKSAELIRQYNLVADLARVVAYTKNDRTPGHITSRNGLSIKANSVEPETDLYYGVNMSGIRPFFDEAQFYSVFQINQLSELSWLSRLNISVFGLKDDFRGRLFPASARLFEVADEVVQLKSPACPCGWQARVNARFIDGEIQRIGAAVAVDDGSVDYVPLCRSCFELF